MAESDIDYLTRTANPGGTMTRQGARQSIERLHPAFRASVATTVRAARAAGMKNAGIYSSYRAPNWGVGGFANKKKSLHAYGAAIDFTGIGRPGSQTAKDFYDLATANGIYNPYGPNNRAEWNHFQLVPTKAAPPEWQEAITGAPPQGPDDLASIWSATGIPFDGTALAESRGPVPPGDLVPLGNRVLKYTPGLPKMQGEDIRNLQNTLIAAGYDVGKFGADGVYGADTRDAVKEFQADAVARGAQIAVDGKVGDKTRPLFLEAMAQQAPSQLPGRLSDEFVRPEPTNIFKRYVEGLDAPAPTPASKPDDILSRMASAAAARSGIMRPDPGLSGSEMAKESPLGILSGVSTRPPVRANATGAAGLGPVADARGTLTVTPDATRLSRDEFLRRVAPNVPAGLANRETFAGEPRGRLSPEFASQPPDPMAEAKARATDALRQQLQSRQPPMPRRNPLDFSGAGGDIQRQVLDEATKRDLTRQLTGVDPRNLPVEAGTGGGLYGPRNVASAPGRLSPEYQRPASSVGFGGAPMGFGGPPGRLSPEYTRPSPESPADAFMRGWSTPPPLRQGDGPGVLGTVHEGLGNASDAIRNFLGLNYSASEPRGSGSFVNNTPARGEGSIGMAISARPPSASIPTGTATVNMRPRSPYVAPRRAPAVGLGSKPIPTVRPPAPLLTPAQQALASRYAGLAASGMAGQAVPGGAPLSMAGTVPAGTPMYGMDKKFNPLTIGLASAMNPFAGAMVGLGQALFGGTGTRADMALADAALRRNSGGLTSGLSNVTVHQASDPTGTSKSGGSRFTSATGTDKRGNTVRSYTDSRGVTHKTTTIGGRDFYSRS